MKTICLDDTIAAIASPPGNGKRGILRISGLQTADVLTDVFRELTEHPEPDATDSTKKLAAKAIGRSTRVNGFLTIADTQLPATLMFWPDHRSYTGQPSAELHTFGSPPLLSAALQTLCGAGARIAQPGEFTMRAFLSGRMDLPQAEAVLAVIDADSQSRLETATRQLAGGLSGPLSQSRRLLIEVLAELEAGLDFVDEDIEFITQQEVSRKLHASREHVQSILQQIHSRNASDDHANMVLIGLPNAGKSSLLNALADGDVALVADMPGTTTDRVATILRIDDVTIELSDTAGFEDIEAAPETIEATAQTRMQEALRSADAVLVCVAPDSPRSSWHDRQIESLQSSETPFLEVRTKADLLDPNAINRFEAQPQSEAKSEPQSKPRINIDSITVSSLTGAGLDGLRHKLKTLATSKNDHASTVVDSTIARTLDNLRQTESALVEACTAADAGVGDELVAAEIRSALDSLGLIVGTIYNDDILDLVFGKFCIGK